MLNKIESILFDCGYQKDNKGIFISGNRGYWSNLTKEDNDKFTSVLELYDPKSAVKKIIPQLEEMIFSEKREAALEFLNLKENGVCIDYGCMWGVMSVGMAKRGQNVIAVDQTYDSLYFLNKRKIYENFNNINIVQDDIRKLKFKEIADYAIVNGVLEWVPEVGDIEISNYYKIREIKKYNAGSPDTMQLKFLQRVCDSLKENGEMVLAIENRYDYQRFIGKKDPHVNLLFTSFFPRWLSNLISKICLGRSYRSYIYSFKELEKIINKAGFTSCEMYMSFPDYHFPSLILPYSSSGIGEYKKYENILRTTKKQKFVYYIEYVIMKFFKMRFFSPAIILVAKK